MTRDACRLLETTATMFVLTGELPPFTLNLEDDTACVLFDRTQAPEAVDEGLVRLADTLSSLTVLFDAPAGPSASVRPTAGGREVRAELPGALRLVAVADAPATSPAPRGRRATSTRAVVEVLQDLLSWTAGLDDEVHMLQVAVTDDLERLAVGVVLKAVEHPGAVLCRVGATVRGRTDNGLLVGALRLPTGLVLQVSAESRQETGHGVLLRL